MTNDLSTNAPKVAPIKRFQGLFDFQFGSPSAPVMYGKKKDTKLFALEEGAVTIDIMDSIYNSIVIGSSFNQQLKGFHKELNEVMVLA